MSLYDLASTAERLLGPTLSELGFVIVDSEATRVTFADGRRAISLSYYREDLPAPWLAVTVGLQESPAESPSLVALWRAKPRLAELQDSAIMTFDCQPQLEAGLERIRTQWLPKYILPLLKDEARVRSALAAQEQELLDEQERVVDSQQLRRARQLFDEGKYRGALDAYALYGQAGLPAADRRRVVMARRFIEDAGET